MSELQTEGLSFEKVWAMFQESVKESDRRMKETDRRMKETDRLIGKLGNRFGELAEHLVVPGIMDKFNALGFHFTRNSLDNEFKDPETGKSLAEVDIMLENGDIVIAVEVKSKPRNQDVDDHIRRMETLRRIADTRRDSRKYRGAIAGAILTDETRDYALAAGLYVLQQSGDTIKLNLPEGFAAREW